jgi:hypothetical protein
MTSFQEFLKKKAEEQNQGFRRELRDEWIDAVNRLIQQIDTWLTESDPEGLLDRTDFTVEKVEAGIGPYQINGLKISVGDLSVQVRPVARRVVGSSRLREGGTEVVGRVDITDGIKKYILWRTFNDGIESWEVVDEQFGSRPFDKIQLESILQDLLS